jgi:hypothetical protein
MEHTPLARLAIHMAWYLAYLVHRLHSVQNNPEAPMISTEILSLLTRDPLNPVIRELCYGVVYRDIQMSTLRTRLAQTEKIYTDLKEENLRLQQELEQATAIKNGVDSQDELKQLEDTLNENRYK